MHFHWCWGVARRCGHLWRSSCRQHQPERPQRSGLYPGQLGRRGRRGRGRRGGRRHVWFRHRRTRNRGGRHHSLRGHQWSRGGQAAIATENALTGQAITEGLGRPEDILRDAAVGGFTAGMAYGVNALFSKPTTILSHYGDEIPPRVRPSFQEWQAVERKFSGGTRLYRIHGPGGAAGHWWLLELPSSEIQFRIDYAVRPEWNPVTHFSILEIPEGYSLKGLIGQAAYQGDFYVGGGMQVYLPKVPKEWISTYPWR